jgi:hypothetical protein
MPPYGIRKLTLGPADHLPDLALREPKPPAPKFDL